MGGENQLNDVQRATRSQRGAYFMRRDLLQRAAAYEEPFSVFIFICAIRSAIGTKLQFLLFAEEILIKTNFFHLSD